MLFMNEGEIKMMAGNSHACPNVCKGVALLLRLTEENYNPPETPQGLAYMAAQGVRMEIAKLIKESVN